MGLQILPRASFIITKIDGSTVTTDKGYKWTLSLPKDHKDGKHADPVVGNTLFYASHKEPASLEVGSLILVEVHGGCGCQNIGLQAVSLSAS